MAGELRPESPLATVRSGDGGDGRKGGAESGERWVGGPQAGGQFADYLIREGLIDPDVGYGG